MTDHRLKPKTIKFLEENSGESFSNLENRIYFLDKTHKTLYMKKNMVKWTKAQFKTSALQKIRLE